MSIDDYVAWARGSGPEVTAHADDVHIAFLALSLLGDAGEVADVVKKPLQGRELDRGRLAHELGDVLYHWARLCAATGIPLSTLLEQSRRSIEARQAKRAQASQA